MTAKQPSLFVSHGTMYEAFKNQNLKADFRMIRKEYLPIKPAAIVIYSAHWQTETITINIAENLEQLDEGFPPSFLVKRKFIGQPLLAKRIVDILSDGNIDVTTVNRTGLDHGALIPLMLLFPDDQIPIVQISLRQTLVPEYHASVAKLLMPLLEENILIMGSGGIVHNRREIQRFGGHEVEPDSWAKEFDDYISKVLSSQSGDDYTAKLMDAYNHKLFRQVHPTDEHYLPLVMASATGGLPKKIYQAFQWKNLSMSSYIFE